MQYLATRKRLEKRGKNESVKIRGKLKILSFNKSNHLRYETRISYKDRRYLYTEKATWVSCPEEVHKDQQNH